MTQRKQLGSKKRQPTNDEKPSDNTPPANPLLKNKTNVSFQVNLLFHEQMEMIMEDSGFESMSELCRTALRQYVVKEAYRNRMLQNYAKRRTAHHD